MTNGEGLEYLKQQQRCLACGAPLNYGQHQDKTTGFLKDYCPPCESRHRPPARPKFDRRAELEAGIKILDDLLRSE